MKRRSPIQRTLLAVTGLAALIVIGPAVCRAQTAAEQITKENSRLRVGLSNSKLPPDQSSGFLARCDLIDKAVAAGSLLQAMYVLQRLQIELRTQEYVASKSIVKNQTLAGFEAEWRRLGRELAAKQKSPTLRMNARLPAALRALAEASLTQVQPYYQSGLLYGRNTTVADGLDYLGLALANLDFALFCHQLRFEAPKQPPKLLPIHTALESLEVAAIKAFQDPSNAEKQRRFIEINSTLKMARELNAERRYEGSLKTYLDALLNFGLVNAAVPDSETTARLRKRAEELRARLTAAATDQSIGLIYLELALAAKSEAEMKRAAVIVEQVLPGYLQSQGETIE